MGERLRESEAYAARTEAGRRVYGLHDVELRPRPGTALPAVQHVQCHQEQVFKGMALAA